jgi:TonB family protein
MRNAIAIVSVAAALFSRQEPTFDPAITAPPGMLEVAQRLAGVQAQGPTEPVRVGGNVQVPKKIKDVKPIYPPEAQSARVQGIVIIEATIGPDGRVASARTIRSIPLLDQAAIEAVLQWEFTPTLLNGVPIAVIMSVTVNFSLGGPPDAPPAPPVATAAAVAPGVADAAPPPARARSTVAEKCAQTPETAAQAVRRQAAIRLVEDVNARQRTAFLARQGKGYVPLDQLTGLTPGQGFEVQLVADDRAYSVSVKDVTDVCAFAFFSDQKGVVYMATPVR